MTERSKENISEEEISLKEVLLKLREWSRFLFRKWKWILLFTLVGTFGGLSYAFLTKPEYTATISFVTDTGKGNNSGFGAYTGLAAQFGLNLGEGNPGGDVFSGGNIYDLMRSRTVLQKTLLTPVIISNNKILLINRYIEIEKLVKKNPGLARFLPFDTAVSKFSALQNGTIKGICGLIAAKELKFSNGSIMSVSFTSKDEIFSKLFLETLLKELGQFYIATRTQKARENLSVLEKQLDSVKSQLYGAMSNVASFQDINQNLVRQGPRVEQQKSSLKMNINSAIYQQLVTGIQAAKMDLQKETPLFEIIDAPVLPLDQKQPGKVKWALTGALLGIFLSAGWLLFRHLYREIMAGE